ncbi:acetate--CoA ligase family protein [Halomarina pelagica]|uniref:acetate--CoA ligase family protein n=1 Tax=Halomarina pelagica TaxID=2961599 RepID=UPI0020C2D8DF|nr:acetate--CoA ligase family protein [Halomarina sp. BND7]
MTDDLSALFEPASIAVVGASADPEKLSGRPHRFLARHGYPGEVYLVNPHRTTIDGQPCYASVADVPAPVDLALVLVPAPHAADVVRECGDRGVPFAVVIASGFAESGNDERQADLLTAARESGVRLVGPNSEGFLNLPDRVAASFSSILRRDDLQPGPVGFVTQSGAFGGALFQLTQDRGIGTSVWLSTGNEADVDTLEVLSSLVDDPDTAVVVSYVESLVEGRRLLDVGRRAAEAGTSIVAMRVGASERGSAAAASHTGSVATGDAVYDAVFGQAGVLRVRSVDEFLDTVTALVRTPDGALPTPAESLGVVSISGGAAVLVADTCDRLGVPLASLSDETVAAVDAEIPAYGSATNPLDVTAAAMSDRSVFERCIGTVADDPAVGPVLVQFGNSGRGMAETFTERLLALRERTNRPVVCVFTGSPPRDERREALEAGGVLVFEDPVRAVAVVDKLFRLAAARERLVGSDPPAVTAPECEPIPTEWPALRSALSACGVPFVPTERVETVEDAIAAAETIGFPVVLKLDPLAVAHKTEEGGVYTDLTDADAVGEAFRALAGSPGSPPIVCQRQVEGVEALVGIREDDDFGPIATVGAGGVFVELFDDVACRALPVDPSMARAMVAETPLDRLFDGYRGQSGDAAAFSELVAGLSTFYGRYDCSTVECNPVVVTSDGALAVDVLVE